MTLLVEGGAKVVTGLVVMLAAAALAAASATWSATAVKPRLPTSTERMMMVRALPKGQTLCYREVAVISGSNGRYGLAIAQGTCGSSTYNHFWMRRSTLSARASWRVLDERSGRIDQRAGCTKVAGVPADIRCR